MSIAFGFEYLLQGFARKDVVQVPSTLGRLLKRDWYYVTRPSGRVDEIDETGTVCFIGGGHDKRNRDLLEQQKSTDVTFSWSFALLSGWRAAGLADFYCTMFLDGRTALAATAFALRRLLRRKQSFVYVKADLDRRMQARFDQLRASKPIGRLKVFLLQSWLARAVDLTSTETEEGRQWLTRTFPAMSAKAIVVRNCPVIPDSDEANVQIHRRLQLLAVGRLGVHQKGTDVLLRAFRKIAERHEDWTLVLVGAITDDLVLLLKPYADLLEKGRIRCEGFKNGTALVRAYRSSTLFVQPSRYEGSPLALIEAIHEGCVPICTPVFPVGEMLGRFESELTIPSDDAEALARCMSDLIRSPDRLDSIREYLIDRTKDWRWDKQLLPVVAAYRRKMRVT